MDMKEKLLAEMEQSDFAKNNGKIMRTLNVLAPSYHNLSSIQRILKDDGIGEGQYAACLDFLALEGYILLRTVKDHVRCEDLADHNWTELEAKLSGKGISPIFTAFCEVVQDVCDIIQRLWTEVIDPILASLVTSLTELWNTHLSPLFSDLIAVGGDAINAIATVIKALWDNVIDPLANWLLSTFGPVFTQVFNSVAGIVTNAIGIVADVLDIGLICLQAVIDFISNLEKVMRDTTRWAKETLGLTIKSAWQIVHFASFVQERQQRNRRRKGSRQRTPGLDMMGYVVRRTYTIIRGRNFVRLRRAILRAQRNLDTLGYVPWWRAQRILSQWGEIKHSDSRGFCTKYNVYKLIKAAKRSASWRGKQLHKLRLEAA